VTCAVVVPVSGEVRTSVLPSATKSPRGVSDTLGCNGVEPGWASDHVGPSAEIDDVMCACVGAVDGGVIDGADDAEGGGWSDAGVPPGADDRAELPHEATPTTTIKAKRALRAHRPATKSTSRTPPLWRNESATGRREASVL
jgi:hypothetical protein